MVFLTAASAVVATCRADSGCWMLKKTAAIARLSCRS